jgi:hypothetical protein
MNAAERVRVDAVVADLMQRSSAPRIVADMWTAMQEVADEHGEFSANDVRCCARITVGGAGLAYVWSAEDVDCDPRRVVGAVYRQLAARGLIERTGRFVENTDTAGHNGGRSHQLPVWRLCSWERPEPVAARITAAPTLTEEDDWLFGDLDVASSARRTW